METLAPKFKALNDAMIEWKALPCALDAKWEYWKGFEEKVRGNHVIVKAVDLVVGADNEIVVQVSEFYKDGNDLKPTIDHTFDKCTIKSDELSLSMGPLFSGIPNRVYSNQSVFLQTTTAGADGKPITQTSATGTDTLVVNGNSGVNTVGAALLNYRLPYWRPLERRTALNFAISAGPTFRFSGSDAKTSRIGFFAGVSAALWRRLYVTPGVHVGEFADYPAGLAPYAAIPAAYPAGQLDGVRRWTAKFGIAIGFRTNSFSTLDVGLTKSSVPPAGE